MSRNPTVLNYCNIINGLVSLTEFPVLLIRVPQYRRRSEVGRADETGGGLTEGPEEVLGRVRHQLHEVAGQSRGRRGAIVLSLALGKYSGNG